MIYVKKRSESRCYPHHRSMSMSLKGIHCNACGQPMDSKDVRKFLMRLKVMAVRGNEKRAQGGI